MPEQILPFYVVCDQSYSMTDHLDALNDGLAQLHAAVGTDPVVADKTRFCLIGFSGEAEVLQPLCRASDVVGLTDLTTQAATSFGEAFTLLRDTIENDVDELKSRGDQVYRPAVFFLSDGHPTDHQTWPAAYERLIDPDWPARPNIIAFGIGDAEARTILDVATRSDFAFVAVPGADIGRGIAGFFQMLTASLIASAPAMASAVPELVVQRPETDQFRMAIDVV
jgi:uncharacterized protein YegL